jgi:hypothetical protein
MVGGDAFLCNNTIRKQINFKSLYGVYLYNKLNNTGEMFRPKSDS